MSELSSIQAGPPVRAVGTDVVPSGSAAPAPPPPEKPVPLFVNPSFKFDAGLGLMVIGFHDDTGKMTSSIPSQRQLDAYRSHQLPLPGEPEAKTPADDKTSAG